MYVDLHSWGAGVKVWVLTGDKEETAINIGYSCRYRLQIAIHVTDRAYLASINVRLW